jgi:hypothetical protein
MCVLATGLVELVGALGYKRVRQKSRRTADVLLPRRDLLKGAVSIVVLLVLSVFRAPRVGALVVERKLQQLSADPTNPQNVQKAKLILDEARRAKIEVAPHVIKTAGSQFLHAAKTPDSWRAAQAFLDYQSSLNSIPSTNSNTPTTFKWTFDLKVGGSEPYIALSKDNLFLGPLVERQYAAQIEELGKSNNTDQLFGPGYVVIKKLPLTLDGVHFKNIMFEDCRIFYKGGSVNLENVYFINCTFHIERRPNGEEFAQALLKSGQSVNFNLVP